MKPQHDVALDYVSRYLLLQVIVKEILAEFKLGMRSTFIGVGSGAAGAALAAPIFV